MLQQIKNLTRHSFIYTVSTFIQRAQGLVMLPVYTDTSFIATRSAYGDYILVYTFIAFMNVFYLYGIDAAFLRYFFLGRHSQKDIYRSAIQVLLSSALLSSIVVFLAAEPLADVIFNAPGYAFFIKIAAGILFFDTLCNLPYLILRAEERSVTFAALRTGRFILELALNLYFVVYLKTGVKGILYANLTAAIINLLVLIPYQWPYLRGRFKMAVVRDLLHFGLPMLPNGLAYLVVELSDRYLMTHLLDKDTVGEYGANYKFGTLMLLLVTAFRTAWQPFFLKIAKQDDARKIYARVMTYFVLGAALVVVSGSLMVEYVAAISYAPGKTLLGREYWRGIIIIPVILSSYLLYGMYVNLTVGIYIKQYSRWMALFTGLAAVTNIASNLYLMPAYGMIGAAWATLAAYAVMMLSIFIFNQRVYPVRYEYGRIGLILGFSVFALSVYYIYQPDFLLRLGIVLLMIILFTNPWFLKKDEWRYLRTLYRRVSGGEETS